MADEKYFKGQINPLAFFPLDEPWASATKEPLTAEATLSYLCTPGLNSDMQSIADRYKEISNEPKRLFIAPAEEQILSKLVWPLRHSKGCYMVGNYLGTIALCGMVAEMITLLISEISHFTVNGKPFDDALQVELFGSKFERLNQERRVSILKAYGLINDDIKAQFDIIRVKRRRYLHFYSQNHKELPQDAIMVFNAAMTIVVTVVGQDIRDGKIAFNPALLSYLEKRGVAGPKEVEKA